MYLDVSDPSNLWVKNPQLTKVTAFRNLKEKEGEEWANRVLYAVYLVHDPLSPYRKDVVEASAVQLRKEVKRNYFSDKDDFSRFNWFEYKAIETAYKKQKSREGILLERLWKKVVECDKYLDGLSPSEDGWSIKDIAEEAKAYNSILQNYLDAKKSCTESSQEGVGYGGQHSNIF